MLFERFFTTYSKFDHPEDVKKIIEYLESIGRLYITYKEVENYYYRYSDSVCCGCRVNKIWMKFDQRESPSDVQVLIHYTQDDKDFDLVCLIGIPKAYLHTSSGDKQNICTLLRVNKIWTKFDQTESPSDMQALIHYTQDEKDFDLVCLIGIPKAYLHTSSGDKQTK